MKSICSFVFLYSLIAHTFAQNSSRDALNETSSGNDTQLEIDSQEILHLHKCPGSTIPDNAILNISLKYFDWNIDEELQNGTEYFYNETDFETDRQPVYAKFTEYYPDCGNVEVSVRQFSGYAEHHLLPDGWLKKLHNDTFRESIPPERYCIVSFNENNAFTVKYCPADCKTETCIPKCCNPGEVCDVTESGRECFCTHSGPKKWTSVVKKNLTSRHQRNISFVHYLNYECKNVHVKVNRHSHKIFSPNRSEFKILENGTVSFRRAIDGAWISVPEGSYCVDGAIQSTDDESPLPHYSGDISDMAIHFCQNDFLEDDDLPLDQGFIKENEYIILQILVPFATVFIVLTIIVYILTWSEQNINGHTIFFYLSTLLALYIFVILSSMPSVSHPKDHPLVCTFIAAGIHFCYLSSTCFLSSVSFNVWRQFSKMDNSARTSRGTRRFMLLFLFSFGYPTLQVFACAILDIVYHDLSEESKRDLYIVLPDYGRGQVCTMGTQATTYYLYIPVAILLVCNFGFFTATIISMIKYKKSIREAFKGISNNTRTTKVNQSFGIYTRLFIIMGIFWASQIISWFTRKHFQDDSDGDRKLEIIFWITDVITVLQAVAIFYIFVCKKTVFNNLWFIHPWLRRFLMLWVHGGCCSIPVVDSRLRLRKSSGATYSTSAGTVRSNLSTRPSRKESTEVRVSRESSDFTVVGHENGNGAPLITEETDGDTTTGRKRSVELTVASDNPAETPTRSSLTFSNEVKRVSFEDTAETSI